jgi:hypothetical protein
MRAMTRIVTTMALLLAIGGIGWSMEKEADATIALETKQVSVGVGWSWGSGTIKYKGETHRFKIDGLSINSVGASASAATGYVYNLPKLSDFEGTYTAVEASGTAGGGKGIATMKNQNGVRITIHSTSQGLEVVAGPEGMKITLTK